MPPSKKRQRLSPKQIRIRDLERDAARRTLNGNGMNGSLPPLPSTEDDVQNDDENSGIGTLFGHPYGALPYGNIHLATDSNQHPDHVRHSGLGTLRVLNDEQLLEVLSFVDGPSLAGGVVDCSRFLYVAGHHEELWRDLVLRRWGEAGFDVPEMHDGPADGKQSDKMEQQSSGCWKDIYAFNHHKATTQSSSQNQPTKHTPISIKGIYSDTFFRSWLCRSFALQPSWLSTNTVPTIDHSKLTTTVFLEEYEETNTPLLIKGASSSWPAMKKWNTEYLIESTNGKSFRATSGAAPLPAQFSMDNYSKYCQSATEEAPLYLFDRTFAAQCPQLLEDFDGALKESCPFWSCDAEHGHDLFGVLGGERRPDHQWLIIGPKRSGSCFHIDPNCTHAWNAPIIGRKRWIFYPPGVTPPGVFPSPCGDDVCMPISLGEWFLTFWDAHVERRSDPDYSRRPLECTACPGDVLFVPHGWWHLVLNIGDSDSGSLDDRGMSVALTRNYVSASNLSDVLRFLDTRKNQISGCRDRGEAIQPDELGTEFRKALAGAAQSNDAEEKKDCDTLSSSEKGRWCSLLEKAEMGAKKGWGCAAWRDIPEGTSCSQSKEKSSEHNKTSILERAKLTEQSETNNDAAIGSGGGFSFSFL